MHHKAIKAEIGKQLNNGERAVFMNIRHKRLKPV